MKASVNGDITYFYNTFFKLLNYDFYLNGIKIIKNENKNNIKYNLSKTAIQGKILSSIVAKLNNTTDDYDSIIFIYCGHGIKDGILTSDNKQINLKFLFNSFNGERARVFFVQIFIFTYFWKLAMVTHL